MAPDVRSELIVALEIISKLVVVLEIRQVRRGSCNDKKAQCGSSNKASSSWLL